MSLKSRTEYLVCTLCVLITGFIMFGLIGFFEPPLKSRLLSFLMFGLIGGFGFSMVLSGIILCVRFISIRSLKFKIIASVFFFITFTVTVYVGMLGYFPYQIYNLVKIIKYRHTK